MTLNQVKDELMREMRQQLDRCGVMYRIFGRGKSLSSLSHKMRIKGEKYRSGIGKIQDAIGIRIVLYFPDDIDVISMAYMIKDVKDLAIDQLNESTFRPRRLNIVRELPSSLVEDFRRALPPEYEPFIDNTYELQIRSIFSEGWHEVEHDFRYKCKEDWQGCETLSRALNGISATLESAEWGMNAIFRDLANYHFSEGNYRAMIRNKMHIRLVNEDLSAEVSSYLKANYQVAERLYDADRQLPLLVLLNNNITLPLTYDNIIFLLNRIELKDEGLLAFEPTEVKALLNQIFVE